MELKLNRLVLHNFKGIQDREIEFSQTTDIYGDNATGKTTIFDGITWLLFDKDSNGATSFGIKTRNENGEVIHNLEHSVEGFFTVDDKTLTLKKVFSEKWTRKRGTATEEFTGHETAYFIDDVPKKKNEYQAKISSIVSEDIFKVLTNPLFFNEKMKWQDRRTILLAISGDISDSEIKGFDDLLATMNGRTADDMKKIISAQMKKCNNEIEDIPVRIAEAQRAMPERKEFDRVAYDNLCDKISNIRADLSKDVNKQAILDVKADILSLNSNLIMETNKTIDIPEVIELNTLKELLSKAQREITFFEHNVESLKVQLTNADTDIKALANEWYSVKAEEFKGDNICPNCGQALPTEQAQAIINKFNSDKAKRLATLEEKGKNQKAYKNELTNNLTKVEESIKALNDNISAYETQITSLNDTIATKKAEFDDLKAKATSYIKNRIIELEGQITALENEQADNDKKVELTEELNRLTTEKLEMENIISNNALIEKQQQRIAELSAQEKQLAVEYANLEKQMFEVENFIRAKVNMLTSKINSMFKYANFTLFNEQINGGLQECCEVTYKGVPYADLNSAAKINVGLDIINTLCDYYNVYVPVVVDNAESVTALMLTKSQQIKLVVSENDKVLRIERN